MPSQNPIANLLETVEQIVFRPAKPSPQYTIKAMLERSHLQLAIEEKQAKLETFRVQEVEFRALLVHAYSHMAYQAERAKFKMETRQWDTGDSLQTPHESMIEALDAHADCCEEIASLERSIEDDQNELNDPELWEQAVRA